MNDDKQQIKFREQEEHSTKERAAILGISYLDTRGMAETAELVTDSSLTISQMYQQKVVPLRQGTDQQSAVYGITSSTPQSVMKAIENDFSGRATVVEFVLISLSGFREYMLRYDPPKEVVYEDVQIAEEGDSSTVKQVSQTLEGVRTDDLLNYLIEQADTLGASDIHLENQRENLRIRMRVDGALHTVAEISHDKYRILFASIASRANISTASQEPQSGHMQHTSKDQPDRLLNMRIETVPTGYGQDAVIRLFNFDEDLLQISRLGLDDKRRERLEELVSHPHGMIMVVGPTGSGKSTTLYSILNALNTPDRKLLTLEDPIEMSITGISQIPVNTTGGDSFADKLRAVLRLDPDVVMVGEIRDTDTAKTAIQASITGHLVLTTFHASSAAAAFARMIDMIGTNPIFANAIRMVLSQRLVRRLDDATKIAYEPDETTKQWIRDNLGRLPDGVDSPHLDNFQLYKPGVSADDPFGYKGRIMIMEQLMVTERIQKFIRGDVKDVDVSQVESAAQEEGMLTMMQDALLKVLRGETTLEEINRVL
ncbi:Flp pilus assembly complex ATPase component TadA [Candidatus Saccharibacteria bacterium]|nr:Flp pilus assembly complex ATPase component TadA [Candidatus Saccharibacteria bacterium]